MHKFLLAISSAVVLTFATNAVADQWDDLYSDPAATPMLNGHPTGDPATNILLRGESGSCTHPSAIPAISNPTPNCNHAGTAVDINLNQFARQSDMVAVQNGLHAISKQADQGVAMSFAMAGVADLQSDEHFAVSGNWGTYNGRNGAAFGVAARLSDHASVNGGLAVPLEGGSVGGRAGIRFGW